MQPDELPLALEATMATVPTEDPKHDDRSWQEIATELSHETNANKITHLAQELNDALDKKEGQRRDGTAG